MIPVANAREGWNPARYAGYWRSLAGTEDRFVRSPASDSIKLTIATCWLEETTSRHLPSP